MAAGLKTDSRKGARRLADVPAAVLTDLSAGRYETVNLMEWLATDMASLARVVATEVERGDLMDALNAAADRVMGVGVTQRLAILGGAIAQSVDINSDDFRSLAAHRSDVVRQWACYAVNDGALRLGLTERLELTLPFAADPNMSVRETAWMAFRPHLMLALHAGIRLLEPLTVDPDPCIRRFAVEVTRPRSVWGSHIAELKRQPHLAMSLLSNVRADPARYVQLAVGNWLNDASKTRPDWVEQVCDEWAVPECRHSMFITRRGRRSLIRGKVKANVPALGGADELL